MPNKVDINEASREELIEVKAIGPAKARNIIDYRNKNGRFSELEELQKVNGIGPQIFSQIKEKLIVDGVKITFDPREYMLGEVNEVHLVGEMNDWNPADRTYALKENEDGIWEGIYSFSPGTEYKIMYDSESWEAGRHIGDGHENFVI